MIIDNLPSMATPAAGDELPIERGTNTYKIDYNALAAAILARVTPANIGAFGVRQIASPTDLNNIDLIGLAFVRSANCANCPDDSVTFFTVLCFGRAQIAMTFDSLGATAVYMRYYTNNMWYPWRKTLTEAV